MKRICPTRGQALVPNGQIEFSGSSETIIGCTIGYTAKLNGSNSSITCDDTWFPPPSNATLELVK